MAGLPKVQFGNYSHTRVTALKQLSCSQITNGETEKIADTEELLASVTDIQLRNKPFQYSSSSSEENPGTKRVATLATNHNNFKYCLAVLQWL
jgi:hypothetical protein